MDAGWISTNLNKEWMNTNCFADETRLMMLYAFRTPSQPSELQMPLIYWQPKIWFFSLDSMPEHFNPSLEYEMQEPNPSFTSNFWNYRETNKIVQGLRPV